MRAGLPRLQACSRQPKTRDWTRAFDSQRALQHPKKDVPMSFEAQNVRHAETQCLGCSMLEDFFKSIHSTAFLEQLKVQILLLPHSFQHSLTILNGSQTVVLIPVSTTNSTRPSKVDLQLGHGSPSGTCRIWNLAREFDDSPAATGVLNGTHHRTERGRVCARFWFWLSKLFSLGLQLKMLSIGVMSHEDHDATMVYASLAGFMIVVLSLS